MTHFHPLVPIVPSIAHLAQYFLGSEKKPTVDYEPYEWLKTHAFPVPMEEWGPEGVGTFFSSIVRGQRGEPNLDWLAVVASGVSALRFEHRDGRPCVIVQVRNEAACCLGSLEEGRPVLLDDLYSYVSSGGRRS